jgi:putative transposase
LAQKAHCEGFNERMREELLNETLFFGLKHARTKITIWAEINGDRTRR